MKALGSISDYNWCKDGGEVISETRPDDGNGSKEDERDLFLEGFLTGYRIERSRRYRLRAEYEEKTKKESKTKKEEKEWRREIREIIEKELEKKLDSLKRTIESECEERRKLKLENDELRKKLEEERVAKEKVEMNWKKLK